MAKTKPLPTITIPPSTSKKAKLSYAQLRSLWIQAGGSPALASQMAAVALAESSGNPADPWRVGYYQGQRGGIAATYKTPLSAAHAAVSADAQQGPAYWPTYASGAYTAFYRPTTPEEKAQASVQQGTVTATAKSKSQQYQEAQAHEAQVAADAHIQGNIEVETATRAAKATAHITDPWVTVVRKGGRIVGFGETYGAEPPPDVLTIGGQPATKSLYDQAWSSVYASDYAAYTGKQATPAVQAQILESGVSAYTLRDQLSKSPNFTSSPIYKATGAGILDQAKQVLGTAPPADFVRRAIAEGWDQATTDAHLRALPQYQTGPVFKQNLAQNHTTYQGIFGEADPEAQQWLHHVTLQGWSPEQVGQTLRSDPAYKYSPEFQAKAVNFLDAMGLITGTTPVVAPATTPQAVRQQTAGSKVGVPSKPLQVSTVGG